MEKLNVSEIFYSLQGEGARAGTPTIFIRLQGCKAKFACAASGIKCDTEFESGREWEIPELLNHIKGLAPQCREITWTGGEPTDQLNEEIVQYFSDADYYQAIETSGLNPVPKGIDFVCVSPKVAEHILQKNFPLGVDELRYVRHAGQELPNPSVRATFYWLSPHSDGFDINPQNLRHCINLCIRSGIWRLSVQQHKVWNVL